MHVKEVHSLSDGQRGKNDWKEGWSSHCSLGSQFSPMCSVVVQCVCAPRGSLCQAALRINFSIAPGPWRLHEILAISLKENIFPQESQELHCRCATVPRALCRFFKNPSSGDNWRPAFVTPRPPFLKWRSLNTKQCLWSSIKVKQAWRSQSLLAEGPKSWSKGPKNQAEEPKSWPEGPI